MDKGSYEYTDLQKKYGGFIAPHFTVYLDGKKLPCDEHNISELEVEINGDGTAGGCSFSVQDVYIYGTNTWDNAIVQQLVPGAEIKIVGGYGKDEKKSQKELFYGYVDDFTVEFSAETPPTLKVNGIDGLGYLMNCRQPIYGGKETPTNVVETILKKAVSAGFAKSVSVGRLDPFQVPLVKEQVDDWRFLKLMARRCGATLMVVDGEMIFNTEEVSKEILTLTLGESLVRFSRRLDLSHQVGEVEIYGRDVNQKPIHAKVNTVTVGDSSYDSAAEMVPAFKKASLREYSEFARTEEECKKLAQNRLNEIAMNFISGSGECIGIPELIPGRYIEIDGGDEFYMNGKYLLTKVVHKFTLEGYRTSFEFKGAKL